MSYRRERYRLRFRGLTDQVRNDIKGDLPGLEARQRGDILLFEIHQSVDMTQFYSRLDSLQLGPEQFDVVASIVTASDNGGIDLPEYILRLIRRTHCGIGFSFVSTGPDVSGDDCDRPAAVGQ